MNPVSAKGGAPPSLILLFLHTQSLLQTISPHHSPFFGKPYEYLRTHHAGINYVGNQASIVLTNRRWGGGGVCPPKPLGEHSVCEWGGGGAALRQPSILKPRKPASKQMKANLCFFYECEEENLDLCFDRKDSIPLIFHGKLHLLYSVIGKHLMPLYLTGYQENLYVLYSSMGNLQFLFCPLKRA